ncbi:YheC/YheD family protein [Brevibacillus sp. SYSU BS000544]|uniref:YheC/YheD family protein n=1 Tax=Brevibacillus sp. SYSU BS000544 TaxID=3416443 RepID=UPI003CE587C7
MPIPSSKWSLHKFYRKHADLCKYLPPTTILSKTSFRSYLSSFHSVYVKPDREHRGKGIFKVWKADRGYGVVHEKGKPRFYRSKQDAYHYIRKRSFNQRYIVQKSIPLAKIQGRIIDVRVMMMRNGQGAWEYAGMIAKVAGNRSIISNVARGKGYALPVGTALRRSGRFTDGQIKQLKSAMERLSYQVVYHFNRYKYSAQIGVDYGIDQKGNISIIEVNFDFPSHSLFAKLQDKTFYHRIRYLAKSFKTRVRR